MKFKLKDILNKTVNKANKQISLDIRKIRLKKLDMTVDDILDIDIHKKLNKFEEMEW